MIGKAWLPLATLVLAAMLGLNSLLGPFLLDVIDYDLSETLENQGIGLDAVSLIIVAPLAIVGAALQVRANRAGLVISLAVAAYAAYMAVQYLVGPNYVEYAHVFPFHLALFILAVVVGVWSWSVAHSADLPSHRDRGDRWLAGATIAAAAFVLLRYFPALGGSLTEEPLPDEAVAEPAFFWTIALMDMGLFVPAAVASAVGVLVDAPWARKAAYAVATWFALVTLAVAGMSIAMAANDDANASNAQLAMFLALSVVVVAFVAWLYRPLFAKGGSRPGTQPQREGRFEPGH